MGSNYKATLTANQLKSLLTTRILRAPSAIQGAYYLTLDKDDFFDRFKDAISFNVDVRNCIIFLESINMQPVGGTVDASA